MTPTGVTIKIKKDTETANEETFTYAADLSGFAGNSAIVVAGGSNTASVHYSEIDYLRIVQ